MTDSRMFPKLVGVHPDLVFAVGRILAAMDILGHPMIVTDGVRSTAQQLALYAKGRTAPGPIVTQADGLRVRSNHQVKGDGFGYAVDMTFLVHGAPVWLETSPWRLYGEMARALGLSWGGVWSRPDKPHIELPERQRGPQ